jgi:hypothetical protein
MVLLSFHSAFSFTTASVKISAKFSVINLRSKSRNMRNGLHNSFFLELFLFVYHTKIAAEIATHTIESAASVYTFCCCTFALPEM